MENSIYYEITLDDDLIAEEEWELRETISMYGMATFSVDDYAILSVTFADEENLKIKKKLALIATWLGRINLDSNVTCIKRCEEYHTNYENEPLNYLLVQGTSGSC